MSRHLPAYPNLEHLKKQAKDLLQELQQQNPASKLADAQHTIAREYGFASWPKLKAHVESLPHPTAHSEAFVDAPSESDGDEMPANAADRPPPIDSRSAGAPSEVNPFVGKWIANLSKSRRHPLNQFQSGTLQFEVVGDTVTITDVGVDASGQEFHGKNTIRADGNEHLSENGNGYVLIARWRGSHVLETVGKKDGQVVGWGRYEVSADGKSLTVSGDEQIIVLDRN